jgi:LemA protein
VLMFNNKVQVFPSNILANIFHFNEAEYFEVADSERSVPEVKF